MNQPQTTRPTSTALAAVTPGFIMVAESHEGYLAIADKITKAGLMPRGFNNNQQAAIAMVAGREFGLSALASLAGFAVVNGRAVPWGVTLRGICKGVGMVGDMSACLIGLDEMRFAAAEEDEADPLEAEMGRVFRRALRRRLARYGWTLKDGAWSGKDSVTLPKNYGCGFAVVKRAGQPVRCELFDSVDAHQAGLLGKSGPWSQYPQRMLEARAMTFALRAAYSDRLAGLDVTADELEEVGPRGTVVVAASSALDDLAGAANPAAPPVQDAEFTEQPQPEANDPPEDPKARGWSNNRGDVGGRDLPGGLLGPPLEPQPELTGTARGLLGMNGTDALRAVVARIRTAGGDANVYQEEACMRGIGEVKSSKAMRDDERYKVAIALAAVYDRAMTPPSERTDPSDGGLQDPPPDEATAAKPAPPVPAEIDF